MSGGLMQELINTINGATPEVKAEMLRHIAEQTQDQKWFPNPGAQRMAWDSEADVIGFGGEAGPGKTDLMIGMSLVQHKRSLILRKTNKEAKKLANRYIEILGHRNGLNTSYGTWNMPDGKLVEYGGCEHEDDKQKYKGEPHDLIGFDEVVDFSRSQVEFIMQWNRTTTPGQRCRVVMTFNPPTKPSGLWVIEYFAPWLDPKHPYPAKSGEIRYFTTVNGRDTEMDGPGPHYIEGEDKPVYAKSRTFIRGVLEENIELSESGYDTTRAAAPKAMRAAYRQGDFEASLADFPGQVIPTAWVRAAQKRWEQAGGRKPNNVPMCAMGIDCTGGGDDPMIIANRYDGWYAPIIEVPGDEFDPLRIGAQMAGHIISYRKDSATVIVDMGGGYGGPVAEKLDENGIEAVLYKGSEKTTKRTRDSKLGFVNVRSAAIWAFREALDPDQEGGSPIMLPDDPELVADLTAAYFEITPNGIKVEPKDHLVERLGRSTNKGDGVVMSWWAGGKWVTNSGEWSSGEQGNYGKRGAANRGRHPVVTGHQSARRKLRR